MRIERTGKVAPLTPRVRRFLVEALGGVDLDKVRSPQERRIDYTCLGGLIGIELKTFEEDGSERIDNLTNQFRERHDWPIFLGSAPMESFLKNTDDPEALRKKVMERLGRNIVNHLKKANDQLEAHAASHPRKNLVRLVIFVNEDHELYDPQSVAYVLFHELRRRNDGELRYGNVDAVLYLTERHASTAQSQLLLPIVEVEGLAIETALWKRDVISRLTGAWAVWNNSPILDLDGQTPQFTAMEDIPEMGPRHERWRLDYRRNPYMRQMTKERLRDRFDEMMYMNTLWMVKGSPAKPPPEGVMRLMESFGHMMQEMADRGVPITDFAHSYERLTAAAKRLKATPVILEWLEALQQKSGH